MKQSHALFIATLIISAVIAVFLGYQKAQHEPQGTRCGKDEICNNTGLIDISHPEATPLVEGPIVDEEAQSKSDDSLAQCGPSNIRCMSGFIPVCEDRAWKCQNSNSVQ